MISAQNSKLTKNLSGPAPPLSQAKWAGKDVAGKDSAGPSIKASLPIKLLSSKRCASQPVFSRLDFQLHCGKDRLGIGVFKSVVYHRLMHNAHCNYSFTFIGYGMRQRLNPRTFTLIGSEGLFTLGG